MLRDRTSYLGGSDAAGVLGLSRWDTPLSVWAEKTGQIIRPDLDTEASELGKELEDYVAKRFARKTGKSVVRSEGSFFHPDHDFLAANVDRLIDGEDAGLECKTCSAWKSKEWEGDEIPQEYIIQCYHYLMVTGKKRWYIAVLIGNQDFKWKVIERDEKLIASMQQREVTFWEEFVLTKTIPAFISKYDTDVLSELFPVAEEGKTLQLNDAANQLIENLVSLKQDSRNVDGLIEKAENELKAMLGEAEAGLTSLYKVRWMNIKSKRLDGKALELAYPDIVKQFKPEKITRRFDYKPLTGEK